MATNTLHSASQEGNTDTVELLISKGTNINQPDMNGDTPLIVAIKNGKTVIVDLLISKGADINQPNKIGDTPLIIAAQQGNIAIARRLVKNDANIITRGSGNKTAVEKANGLVTTFLLKKIKHFKWLAHELREACHYRNRAKVERLIESKAPVDWLDKKGWTPLTISSYEGYIEIVQLLISKGANVNTAVKTIEQTPLYIASEKGETDIVKLLITKGANVNTVEKTGRQTPLHVASKEGKVDIVELLISKGADIDKTNEFGDTPLCVAFQKGKADVVELLIKKKEETIRLYKEAINSYLVETGKFIVHIGILIQKYIG